MALILAGRIDPVHFITHDTQRLIKHYQHYKAYGMNYLYPSWDETPNQVLEAFDIIANEIAAHEQRLLDKPKEGSKV